MKKKIRKEKQLYQLKSIDNANKTVLGFFLWENKKKTFVQDFPDYRNTV